jgi:hypothetical protein
MKLFLTSSVHTDNQYVIVQDSQIQIISLSLK